MDIQQSNPTKKKPKKIDEMSKEQIRQAIIKKRECNAKAQTIVESFLEKNVNEQYFLRSLPDINQTHFEDVIEERCILNLCGFPLCQNSISQRDIPKQKYRISIKTNKVYDITARKSFCSNSCYVSAMHVKKQMLTSPLWFREYEEIPKFHLLPLNTKGSLGQEVELSIPEMFTNKSDKNLFSSNNELTKSTNSKISNKVTENYMKNDKEPSIQIPPKSNINPNKVELSLKTNETQLPSKTNESELPPKSNKSELQLKSNDTELQSTPNGPELPPMSNETEHLLKTNEFNQCDNKDGMSKTETKKPLVNPFNIVGEIVEKPVNTIDPILTAAPINKSKEKDTLKVKKTPQKKQHIVTTITIEVEKCLAEWFTLDTMLFLFGESKVKEMVADKGDCIKEYLNNFASSIFYTSNTYDQYQALCRKLNMLELEDRRYDAQTLARETKPLPDYSILKEESKRMQLKIKAYLAGETDIPEPDSNVPEENTSDENTTRLPLVDKTAQNALRRKIVCQHLDRVLPDILQSLGLLNLSISSDIRLLVNTFRLKANNIMFKPIQWTLIAIVLIKLLSLRDKRLEYLLNQPTTFQHMQLLLLSYKQDGGYLERLLSWLTDVDRLLDVNDTQLTIS